MPPDLTQTGLSRLAWSLRRRWSYWASFRRSSFHDKGPPMQIFGRVLGACSLVVLSLPGAACTTPAEPPQERTAPVADDVKASDHPEAVLVDAFDGARTSRCSGTLLAPRVVLTA